MDATSAFARGERPPELHANANFSTNIRSPFPIQALYYNSEEKIEWNIGADMSYPRQPERIHLRPTAAVSRRARRRRLKGAIGAPIEECPIFDTYTEPRTGETPFR